MASFHGNFFVRSTDLLAMPAVPQDQSYAIEVQIEETINAPFVVFQTAVLHTTCYGLTIFACRIDYLLTTPFYINRRTTHSCHHAGVANDEQLVRALCVGGSGRYRHAFG